METDGIAIKGLPTWAPKNNSAPTPLPAASLSLVVLRTDESSSYEIFNHFTLPSLSKLRISAHSYSPHFSYGGFPLGRNTAIFYRLTSRDPPPVTSLELSTITFDNFLTLYDLLSSLSGTLARLSILSSSLPGAEQEWGKLLEKMSLEREPKFLPHLEELELDHGYHWTPPYKVPNSLLIAMVESRWRVEASPTRKRLLRVHIQCRGIPALERDISDGLAAFSEQGLQVEVSGLILEVCCQKISDERAKVRSSSVTYKLLGSLDS
ncbi:hypothetical protein V5O48_014741 [Marasmius crinis-equi]|uniref:Uncharacterized protein n=1 Tax=Marasmius crinis-equi TaxID=585013 RepID=A0ABR3EWG0_9AGAR